MHVRSMIRKSLFSLLFTALLLGGSAGLTSAAPRPQSADEGEAIFQARCAACHTFGGGPLAGPDLQGVAGRRDRDWLARWLAAPDKLLAGGDPIALQLLAEFNNVPMPNMGLTEAEVQALIAYMETREGVGAAAPVAATPVPDLPAGNPARGKALFTGNANLRHGGPACTSCHTVAGLQAPGGGSLGPDLTPAHAKYGGDAGMAAVLAELPFPTMKPVYAKRPLTPGEQADLLAFMQAAGQGRPVAGGWQVALLAMGGFVVLMGALQVVWRRRLRGVRKPLVQREEQAS